MKVFLEKNVFEAALDRLRYLFDREENIYVASSGGKDSTVVMELTAIVAKEKGRLPLKVAFLDQESEYQSTIDYFKKIQNRPDIQLYWFQVPFRLGSNLSRDYKWLYAWHPEQEKLWLRPHQDGAITDLGDLQEGYDMRFYHLGDVIGEYIFGKNARYFQLCGIRADESLARRNIMFKPSSRRIYNDLSWVGWIRKGQHPAYKAYPIYDFSFQDIWKAINDNHWAYNSAYDKQFQIGKPINKMRVSSFIHENGIAGLETLQAIEPKTFDKLVNRIGGLSAYKHLHESGAQYSVGKLPPMFSDWHEYRNYIFDEYCDDEEKAIFMKTFKKDWDSSNLDLIKAQILTMLKNDICTTTYHNVRIGKDLKRRYYGKQS